MNSTVILILASIILLLLIFPLLFFLRKRVELRLENDILYLDYPLSTKKIDLSKELYSWNVQKSYYIRWGMFHAITIRLKNGKRVAVNSLFNQENYDRLYARLSSNFPDQRKSGTEVV